MLLVLLSTKAWFMVFVLMYLILSDLRLMKSQNKNWTLSLSLSLATGFLNPMTGSLHTLCRDVNGLGPYE